ncbi:solute carrier family 22 member 4-like [Periophthalmus magnuspinnatus]|uniref:solute carrier family 22 member 4-like n=1 Tax=Periophthalmus magnuspinnatus TaxID=409849 RepID=UPI0024368D50|nr:solute carrier family 22 member 4-like [Periophthalmus magnuspinnatus]
MKDYEESIAFLGQWGCFQFVIFFVLCASIMPNGFGAFTLVFLTDVPPHHCTVPEANLTEEWQKAAIPLVVVNGVEEQSRCSRYRLDEVLDLWAKGFAPGDVNLTQLQQEPCVDGWTYSKDIYHSTLVTEFDLVCHDEWKQPLTASVFYAGVTVGSLFSGELSDKFGRKPILFATMAVQTIFTFIQVFANSWILFTVLLFFNGLGQMSNFVAALVLGAEILTGHARVMYSSVATNSAFALGYMLLPLFAYFLRDWRGLTLGLSLPGLLYVPMWWLIPESPRWLLFQGKVKEAEAIIRKAARWNKIPAPQNIFHQFTIPEKEKDKAKKNYSVIDLFKTSTIRITTLNLFLIWFIMFLAYYALNLNTSQLHPNPYLSCFISALVELPAYTCSWLTLRKFPRRASIIAALCLGAAPLYFIQLIPKDMPTVVLVVEMTAKFWFTAGTCLMFTYTSELYPTPLRNTATGACSMVSRIGSCVAPFLLKLSVFLKFLPHITTASLALFAAFVTLFIPESFGHPLPETMEQMATRESVHCPCQRRKEPIRTMVPAEDPL